MGRKLKEVIKAICNEYEWEIGGLEVMEEHVHLFVSCQPRYAPAQVMNIIKSLTARELFAEYSQMRKVQWSGRIWADGYYVGSSGEDVTNELIKKYIAYQKGEIGGAATQMRPFDKLGVHVPKRKSR